ncbi:MAG: UDP-2,3-diacylglucosamine diphosphatase [Candidatus Zixiibacteriota bacterium]
MTDSRPIIFYSDAHFGAHSRLQEDVKVERFVGLLEHAKSDGAEVFFLGDLFDFWFEYRHWIPKAPLEVLASIQSFTKSGLPFHMVLGNHDIWAADYFERDLGAVVHRQDVTLTRQGLRLLISHGDGKAPSDGGYRALKRVLRFRPNVALYRLLPADLAFRMARFSSGHSRELTAARPPRYLPEYDAVAESYLKSGFDAVLMGHLHQGWVRRAGAGWWINTGEFFEKFTYVRMQDGEFRLHTWNPSQERETPPQKTSSS